MNSNIRQQDALELYNIIITPGNGGENLNSLLNILGKCRGVSSDSGKGRGGHNGGTVWVTTTGGIKVQLFTYTNKSYTQEKVTELIAALRPVAHLLTDENLRRVFTFANQDDPPELDTSVFIAKTISTLV